MAIPFLGPISLGSSGIIDLANPVNPQDAATKAYVDSGKGPSIVEATATPVFDGLEGNLFQLTLAEDVVSSSTIHLTPGLTYFFLIVQPVGASYTFVWPANMRNAQPIAPGAGLASLQAALCLADGSTVTTGPISYGTYP